jgi:hypothetical protein
MLNTRGLPQSQQLESLSQRLQELDRVRNSLLNGLGIQSADAQNLLSLQSHVTDLQLQTRVQTSTIEDVDLTQVAITLASQQNLLQLTLSHAAHIFDPSLLNFLGSSPS